MSRLYGSPVVCWAYLSRDLELLHGRRRIRESWNLLLLLYFIRRMLEYIYGKKIPCFRDKFNASKRSREWRFHRSQILWQISSYLGESFSRRAWCLGLN